ncbi:MAG: ABC transporter permease, partial [Solirubrobacteraceae bacterium]
MITYARQTSLLTWRSLRALPRVPQRLLDVTLQPIIFILLFLYVFGSAIHIRGIDYHNFLMPGIIAQGLAFGMMGTGVATTNDMNEGVIDRFRSMPVSRISILSGQVMGQYCEQLVGLAVYGGIGYACGWRPQIGVELMALTLLALLAFTWMGVFFGLLVRSPDAMQGLGFAVVFPLTFLAGTFVPISGMPAIPRAIGDWDPISAFVATIRKLAQGFPAHGSWMLDHCELAMLGWSLLLIAIFVPLALRRFN